MKVYINDTSSLIEYLYLKSLNEFEQEVYLSNSISDSDVIINCDTTDLYYDKTIILTNDHYQKDTLEELAKFNKVISRFPLDGDIQFEYELVPYIDTINLKDFEFDGTTRNVLSRLSIKQFIILKSQGTYKMKSPQIFVNTNVKGYKTQIGYLQSRCKSLQTISN